MPDFLRVTKPMVPQTQNVQPKPGAEPTGAFNIQSTVKVVQTHNQSELLKQNNTLTDGNDVPTLLLDLLKDPTVTVSYLKNIFMLEELYTLLPANNKTVSNEIQDILDTMLLKPENLSEEMRRQMEGATAFAGESFDFFREVVALNKGKNEVLLAVARLLRSLDSAGNQREILDSIANNLSFLQARLGGSKNLSARLDALIAAVRAPEAQANFNTIKADILAFVKSAEESLLYTPEIGKTLSILVYNLSRYYVHSDYAAEAAYRLSQYLNPKQKMQLREWMQAYLDNVLAQEEAQAQQEEQKAQSKVMEALVKLIHQQEQSGKGLMDEIKLEKMLHSLLSSPCNFTPLLHFILPLQYNGMKAFAELWINPDSDERDMPEGASKGVHLLMVVDVEGVGLFEAEFFVYDSTIDFLLYCPKGSEAGYEALMASFPRLLAGTQYQAGKTRVLTFENTRSLMEVFKSLPYRRVGVDVKV